MPPSAPTNHRALTAELAAVLELSDGRGTTLNALLLLLSERGMPLLMVVATVPFLIPVTIPGLSVPFGAALACCGVCTARAVPIRLPQRLGRRHLPHSSLEKIIGILRRVFARLERLLHPRYQSLATSTRLMRVHGVYVLLMAIVLAIPFPPVPFVGSNAVAACPIFLLGLGLLERDGLFVALAYVWMIIFTAYWIFFGAALIELAQASWPHLQSLWS